jgi:putative FmdB family regulatory protein
MPLYEYQCESCAHRFERIQKFSDPPVETCPNCQGTVRRLLSSPAIQFKGSGWYITDYARKSGGESKKAAGDEASTKSDGGAKGGSESSAPPSGGGDAKSTTKSIE